MATKKSFPVSDPEKLREYASLGGKAVHALGRGRQFTSEEARAAGKKSGAKRSRDHMAAMGRKGGAVKKKRKAKRTKKEAA